MTLDGLTLDEARERIRGPKGSVVTLTIKRGEAEAFALEITRDVIQQEEVETPRLLPTAPSATSGSTASRIAGATSSRRPAGAHRAKRIRSSILDLRGNPGGYVTAARVVASQFIASGPVFWEQDATGTQVATDARTRRRRHEPATSGSSCLIDGGSASASEIVAGALQDTGRATLVGQTSFGKGTVQEWQELTGEGGGVPPDRRALADAEQALDPRRRPRAARSRSTCRRTCRPARTRRSTGRSRCSARRRPGRAGERPPDLVAEHRLVHGPLALTTAFGYGSWRTKGGDVQ